MSNEKLYTKQELDIEILKEQNEGMISKIEFIGSHITRTELDVELLKNNDSHLFKALERIESNQKWMLGIMGTGFIGLLSLMAHGFKWIM